MAIKDLSCCQDSLVKSLSQLLGMGYILKKHLFPPVEQVSYCKLNFRNNVLYICISQLTNFEESSQETTSGPP